MLANRQDLCDTIIVRYP